MTHSECAEVLRSLIRRREELHKNPVEFIGESGRVEAVGPFDPEQDTLYCALKHALSCVESMSEK